MVESKSAGVSRLAKTKCREVVVSLHRKPAVLGLVKRAITLPVTV